MYSTTVVVIHPRYISIWLGPLDVYEYTYIIIYSLLGKQKIYKQEINNKQKKGRKIRLN